LTGHYREWKVFKDFIRTMTLDHQPGWTNTGPNYSWPEGWNFFGYFTVKTDRDAQRAFGTSPKSVMMKYSPLIAK